MKKYTERIIGLPYRLIVLVTTLQVLPPLAPALFLKPEGPVLPLVVFMAAGNALFFLACRSTGGTRRYGTLGLVLLLIAGAFVILSDIVITPYSAYLSWFQLIDEGEARGAISFLFVMLAGYFSTLFTGFIYGRGLLRPLAAEGFAILILLSVIHQQSVFFLLAVAILMVGLGYSASYGYRGKAKSGPIRGVAGLAAVSFALALPLSAIVKPQGSSFVDLTLSPLLRETLVSVYPDFPIIYGIPGYGYSFDRRGTGNSPLLSERPIFEVKGKPGTTIYLRTAVYTTYQNGTWAIDQYILDDARRRSFGLPDRSSDRDSSDRIEVTLLQDFYSMIPHTLNAASLTLEKMRAPALQYGSKNTGYFLTKPIVRGERIRIVEAEWDSSSVERGGMRNRSAYLQLPMGIAPSLTALSQRFRSQDPYSLALEIREYLARRSIYTLDTRRTPAGTDLVEDFLFTSQAGYCVHFASAFVILARLRGLPSRYVTGFLVNIPFADDTARISGLSAHAWPEVWISERGWVSVEATPPMIGGFSDDEYYDGYYSDENELTSRQLDEILGNRQDTGIEAGDADGITDARNVPTVPLSAILLVLPALVLLPGSVFALRRSGILIRDPMRKLQFHAAEAVRRARSSGIPSPDRNGWTAWGREVQLRLGGGSPSGSANGSASVSGNGPEAEIGDAVKVLLGSFYRGREPDRKALDLVRRLRRITAALPRGRRGRRGGS